jgi:hypothetical protein
MFDASTESDLVGWSRSSGHTMLATLLKIAYQLRHHCLGEWPLDRWAVTLTLVAAAIIPLRWLVLDRPQTPLDWASSLLLVGVAIGVSYLGAWARRRMYVDFEPQAGMPSPAPKQLDPTDKVAVYPTGQFEVEGKSAVFVDLLAYWRSFASREHTIMAIVRPSRFLLLGKTAARDLGMWYIFFTPQMIAAIAPGTIAFGKTRRLGLRVTYRFTPPASGRQPPQPITQVRYIGFADEIARHAVWADILAD